MFIHIIYGEYVFNLVHLAFYEFVFGIAVGLIIIYYLYKYKIRRVFSFLTDVKYLLCV